MLHKLPHVGRKVTPPQPTFMTDDQKSDYLASLRQNRPARPTGSRPAPFKSRTSIDQHVILRAESAMCLRGDGEDVDQVKFEELQNIPRSQSSFGHRHSMLSEKSTPSSRSAKVRSLVRAAGDGIPSTRGRKVSSLATVEPFNQSEDVVYKESGKRWLERQEAHALRQALEVMDAQEEEKRIHNAAHDEAADLVWQHRHPGQTEQEKAAGYRNPDLTKKLKSHLVRGAHDRTLCDGNIALSRANAELKQLRTAFEGLNNSQPTNENPDPFLDKTGSKKKRLSGAMQQLRIASGQAIANVDAGKSRNFSGGRRRMSGQRNVSNKSTTFTNPDDKIFEEPQEMSANRGANDVPKDVVQALKISSQNSLPRAARQSPQKAETMPVMPKARPNPFDRRRRQAEQPKAAPYTSNAATPPRAIESENVPTKDGKEIRGDDIRAATSMKRSDRSPKLPTPTAVSDRAGRPIVSFDTAWKSPSEKEEQRNFSVHHKPEPPSVTVSAHVVPTINLPNDETPAVPAIRLLDDDDPYDPPASLPETSAPGVPTFSFDGPDDHLDNPAVTALSTVISPTQPAPPARPLPQHTQSMPVKSIASINSKLPWLPRGPPTATCASCTLPISGRVVTASDASQQQKARFHPECFTCAHCSTALECVAFYPEPQDKRVERVEQNGLQSENDALRFYCHLDFHEFYSPRCRSCKTPIEGEVILAAGGEYHVGHFFCAECGDPFENSTPFVEKGGYAYCVSCHRKRTSGRCRGCKALILDEGCLEALEGQWHEKCFVCFECSGDFGEDGRFYLREVEVEITPKERRRGIERKVEEKPVCQGCEEIRLKQ